MAEKIEFKRGDSKIMKVTIPRSIYEANSRLYFSAKPAEFNSDGETVELDGELEYTTPSGKVLSFPNNNKFLKVLVYPDIRRKGLDG